MIDKAILVDLIRHRYNSLCTDQEKGVAIQSLSRISNLFQRVESDEQASEMDPLESYLAPLGEFDHKLERNFEEIDPEDIFSVPKTRQYRIIGRKPGYFPLDGPMNRSLLFDSRSIAQLSNEFGVTLQIELLPLGHRLISTEQAQNLGLNQLDSLPDFQLLPHNPIDLLDACFEDEDMFNNSEWLECDKYWMDLESNRIDIRLFAKDMRNSSRGSLKGWTRAPNNGLRIVDQKGDRIFGIELLFFREEPQDHHDDHSKPFMRAFRLHRWLDLGNGEKQHNKVVLFHPESANYVPPPFREYIKHLHPKTLERSGRYDLPRDVLRAFVAAGDKIQNVNDPNVHLIGYQYRSLFQEGGLIANIKSEAKKLIELGSMGPDCWIGPINFEKHIRSRLWLENLTSRK